MHILVCPSSSRGHAKLLITFPLFVPYLLIFRFKCCKQDATITTKAAPPPVEQAPSAEPVTDNESEVVEKKEEPVVEPVEEPKKEEEEEPKPVEEEEPKEEEEEEEEETPAETEDDIAEKEAVEKGYKCCGVY